MEMKLGLFGGSFDPVHLGHLLVAQATIEELALDRLFLIPAAQSPFKTDQQHADGAARLRLLRLALAGRADCEVDDQELRRGGISYTIDTLRDYARRFPQAQLFYLIGADNVASLPKWREAQELAKLAEFVAIPRPGDPVRSSGFSRSGPSHEARDGTPNTPAVHAIEFPPPFRGRMLKGFPFGVSSSQIRARVKTGLSIDHLVVAPVAEAIHDSRLYL
jgi:nicotinate-nucleotide adenylyltransferase